MGAERVVDGKELSKEVCETRKNPEELERELAAWRSVLFCAGNNIFTCTLRVLSDSLHIFTLCEREDLHLSTAVIVICPESLLELRE